MLNIGGNKIVFKRVLGRIIVEGSALLKGDAVQKKQRNPSKSLKFVTFDPLISTMNNTSDNIFNIKELLSFVKLNKRVYLWSSLLAVVVLSLVAYYLPNQYQSHLILYPASSSSISQSLLEKNVKSRDILKFGEEEEVEQIQQILQSDIIRKMVVEKYHLFQHYDLKKSEKYAYSKLLDKYEDNVSIRRTQYNSIKIEVYDHSPDTAALIANDIANFLDTVMNNLQHNRALKAFKIVEKEYLRLQEQIKSLNDSLTYLRSLGVNDYESQAEVLNQALAQAIIKNNKPAIKTLEKKIAVMSRYGSAYMQLSNYLEYQTEQLSIIHSKYTEAKVDVEQHLPHKFIVSRAYPAERPTYPIRWLIVLSGLLSLWLLLTFVLLIFRNNN